MLLDVQHVTKAFPRSTGQALIAVKDLSFGVNEGQFISLLGPSGCGKSTLARLLAGLDFPTSGQLIFDGAPISGPSHERVLTFQSYASFPWLNVEDNIRFGLRGSQVSHAERKARTEHLLHLVGLREFRKTLPHELSGGMQQRLAIARSFAVQPRLLILDEPFSSVDAITRTHLQSKLRELVDAANATTILVTHDVEEAIALSDRILVVSNRPAELRLDLSNSILAHPWRERIRESMEFQGLRKKLLVTLEQT